MNGGGGWLDWVQTPRSDTGIHLMTAARRDSIGYDRLSELASVWTGSVPWRDDERRDAVLMVATPSVALFGAFFGLITGGSDVCLVAPPAAMADQESYRRHLRGTVSAVSPRLILCEQRLTTTVAAIIDGLGEVALGPLPADGLPDPDVMAGVQLVRAAGPGNLLQLTSGSSGVARCVELSPRAVSSNVLAIARWLGVKSYDATVSWLPLYHDMGLIGCFLASVDRQIDLYLMDPVQFVRSPTQYLAALGRGRGTISAMPPFGLEFLTRRVSKADLTGMDFSTWRTLIVGAEPIPIDLLDRFCGLLEPGGFQAGTLCPAYGMAESTLAVTGSFPGDLPHAAALPGDDRRYVSCGRPLSEVSVRVVNAQDEPVTGEIGEIVVRSPGLAHGYRGMPTGSTRFEGGELWTGDAGFLTDGELHVVGRLGDAIKIRGTWLFAEDLEALMGHPAFRDGRAAIAMGDTGDIVRVLLVCDQRLDLDTDNVARYLRAQAVKASIAVVRVPRRDIPRTSSGKPRRREMWHRFAGQTSASRQGQV